MDPRTFGRTLRQLANRVPFRRFQVESVSGTHFTVDHPEALVFRGGTAIFVAPDGTPWWFDHESVSHLRQANGARARK